MLRTSFSLKTTTNDFEIKSSAIFWESITLIAQMQSPLKKKKNYYYQLIIS